ncbi:sulfate ABC transporter substrate-binding protein [Neisseria sp. Ec49-e6-T10]|uniref:sulfate ABC transporter substrate-binding protein n=1 Tax=Neisseria sp. Ec49-e6-T10 TaxID=3140744 RepID=UPI003EBC213C
MADTKLLNVSYDVMRDFYKDYNPLFVKSYQANNKEKIAIQQSHGGSSKQVLAVSGGLQADVVTMNQASDIDFLVTKGLIAKNWASRLPNNAVPFTSTTVFLVRKGNPKNIQDWADLTKNGVKVIIANPKTSGNGRYAYLAAYGQALKTNGNNDAQAKTFVKNLFNNVPILDAGGRAATTTFMQRKVGDVLITFENEAEMVAREFGRGSFQVVYPKLSISAENPVAVVDKVVTKKGTQKAAEAYLKYLWSEPAQELAAKNFLRPQNAKIAQKYSKQFPKINTFRAESLFGNWDNIMKKHFADGGVFDQIYKK